jgi:hypothetical protein
MPCLMLEEDDEGPVSHALRFPCFRQVSQRARVSTRTLKHLIKKWRETKQVPLPERGRGSLKEQVRKEKSHGLLLVRSPGQLLASRFTSTTRQ